MTPITLPRLSHFGGVFNLPGSKSLTNRALLLSALSEGTTRLHNVLVSDDTTRMREALSQLGIALEVDGDTLLVSGVGGPFDVPVNTNFFLGNAGTAIRPLTAALAHTPGTFTIDGARYMRERPIAHLAEALSTLGTSIHYEAEKGYPPLRLRGGTLRGGHVDIPGNISSQFLTALLMSLPLCSEDSTVSVVGDQVSTPYLDITLSIMARYGVHATHENYSLFRIPGGQNYVSPGEFHIEGDASSASYFLAAAAITGDSIQINGIGDQSVQGDVAFLDVLEAMGATVTRYADHVEVTRETELVGIDLDLNHIPDAAMTVAALALFANGTTTIRNIYNWRVKETDRMHAMKEGLVRLGATVDTGEDWIAITPPTELHPASINPYGDHRVAMSFSLAAFATSNIIIEDRDCTAKTFPNYFETFLSLSDAA